MPEWLNNLLKFFGIVGESAGGSSDAPQGAPQDQEKQPDPAPTSDSPPWFALMEGKDDDLSILPSPQYDGSTTLVDKGWAGLTSAAKDAWNALSAACSQINIDIRLDEGYRPRRRQAYLYAQGRTRQPDGSWAVTNKGVIVTNAKPGQSVHQSGRAFDLHILLPADPAGKRKASYDEATLTRIATVAKGQGLRWGGDFRLASGGADTDHFEAVP